MKTKSRVWRSRVRKMLARLRVDYTTFGRFLDNIRIDGRCMIWTGAKEGKYGRFRFRNIRHGRAHVAAFVMFKSEVPILQPLVCHTCDRTLCVWFEHLFAGTNKDNIADRDRKGRQATGDRNGMRLHPECRPHLYGEHNGASVLKDTERRKIRQIYMRGGTSMRALGRRYGVAAATVCRVVQKGAA